MTPGGMSFPSCPRASESSAMIGTLSPKMRRLTTFAVLAGSLGMAWAALAQERPGGVAAGPERPSGIAASKADLLALTPLWKGDRYPDGRPRAPEDLLRRL